VCVCVGVGVFACAHMCACIWINTHPLEQRFSAGKIETSRHFARDWRRKIVFSRQSSREIAYKDYIARLDGNCTMSHGTYEWVMARMNSLWHIYMSYGTYKWVRAHMNELWRIWMRHGTYKSVATHLNESWHIWLSHVTYELVMTHTNESWHIWMSHGTNFPQHLLHGLYGTDRWQLCNGSWHTWMSHVTHTNESCQTCEWDTAHMPEA